MKDVDKWMEEIDKEVLKELIILSKADEIEEKLEMRITPITVIEVEKLLDWLAENGEYMAQIGKLSAKYKGIAEDTINGKRQMFYIEREIKQ